MPLPAFWGKKKTLHLVMRARQRLGTVNFTRNRIAIVGGKTRIMKDSGLPATRMSPCLRLFIESLLDGLEVEITLDESDFPGDALAIRTSLASSSSLESDTNYN